MKKIFTIAFAFCCVQCLSQNAGELTKFKEKFESITIPFNSTSLNESATLITISKRVPLPGPEVVAYILNGNRHGLEYLFEKYDMETGESKGLEQRGYEFYPVYKIEYNGLLLLVTLRTCVDSQSYFLSVYNPTTGKGEEAIEINKLDGEDEYKAFKNSYLDTNLQLRIVLYEINPSYLQNLKGEKIKSIITETTYRVDQGVKLIKKIKKQSECSVSDFYEKKERCASEDPMRYIR